MRFAAIRVWLAAVLVVCGFLPSICNGQTTLSHLFSDHAVLQREMPLHVWGWDNPKQSVAVSLHGQSASAVSDGMGRWDVWLKPENAGGPYEMKVAGSTSVEVKDLLIGDVWIASGQSNMQMPLKGFGLGSEVKQGQEAIAAAKPGKIRLLTVEWRATNVPSTDMKAAWVETTPETAAEFSAVGYFFGREISEREDVPVGLIDSTWGGTPLEAWMSMDAIGQDASLMPLFASRGKFANQQINTSRMIAEEKRQDEEADKAHQPRPAHSWHAPNDAWVPTALYNGMIAQLVGYGIKGVIWYQGESNAEGERAQLYARLMPALIEDWRARWAQGDFPFLYVQLAGWSGGEQWGTVRDAQRRALFVRNTGMAVAVDIGSEKNIHPPDKPTVASRLALAARSIAYGEHVEFAGPLYRQATVDGTSMRVWFDHAAGLHARGSVAGLEIAGSDGKFVPANGVIEGETVVVSSDTVAIPRYVRYGWAGWSPANLYNGSDLPAATFTTEP